MKLDLSLTDEWFATANEAIQHIIPFEVVEQIQNLKYKELYSDTLDYLLEAYDNTWAQTWTKKGTDLLLEPFNLSKKPKTRDTSRFYEIKPFILTLTNIDNLLRAIPERHYDLIMLFNGPAVTLLQTEECAPYREEIWQLQQTWVSFKVCKSQPAVYRGYCATSARGHRPVCAYSYGKQTALHGWERPPRRRSY